LEKLRDRLLRLFRIDLSMEGQDMTLPLLEDAAEHVHAFLPSRRSAMLLFQDDPTYALEEKEEVDKVKCMRREAVRDAFAPFAGKKITCQMLETIAIEIAGWWEEAALGLRRPAWQNIRPSWAALFIEDLVRIPCKGRMFKTKIRSYAGPSAGCVWSPVLSGGALQMLLRDAGCKKYDEYKDEDAAGIWFTAQVSFREGRMRFLNTCCSSSQERLNKDLQRRRTEKCIGPFPAMHGKGLCCMCPISMDACPNARSAEAYSEIRLCRCKRKGYFRPDVDTKGWCLNCLVTGRYKRHVEKTN
jgi:hypothetical protein